MNEIPLDIRDSYFSFLLKNKGNHAEVGVLNRIKRYKEMTTRTRPIPNENDIYEVTYDELFKNCPKDGIIVLELGEPGDDRIENFLNTKVIYHIESKVRIAKNTFIQDFEKYCGKIALKGSSKIKL